MAAPKQPATITARRPDASKESGYKTKKFRTTVWNLLPANKFGWEQISGTVETPVEAKKVSPSLPEKVSIKSEVVPTPPEAVKVAEVAKTEVAPLPPKTPVAKAKSKAKKK